MGTTMAARRCVSSSPERVGRASAPARLQADDLVHPAADVDYVAPGFDQQPHTFGYSNQTLRDLLATGAFPMSCLPTGARTPPDRPDWFATDGVHYRQIGTWAAADYLSSQDGLPRGSGLPDPGLAPHAPSEPVPRPDVTGPVADVAALYPIGPGRRALLRDRRRPSHSNVGLDTHVIQTRRGC